MLRWNSSALLANLAYVVEERAFDYSQSLRQLSTAEDFCAQLEEILKRLPREQRLVVELAYRFRLSREDIATILNTSVESVSKLMIEGTTALTAVF
jgi:DNA-directed RNA polymerase specialized sigma24 family protein